MNQENNPLNRGVNPLALHQLKKNANWYLMLGIGLVILGTLAVMFSVASTLFSVMYLGALLVMVGIFEGIKSFKINLWGSFFLHVALAILYIACGIYMIVNPMANALALTLLLAIFFVVSGVLRIGFSFVKNLPHRGWLLVNGILTLVLGLLIWQQWPSSGVWALGMLVGIDMIFTGWTWIMLSLRAKSLPAA